MTRAPSLAPTAAEQRRNMIRFEAAVRNISEGLCMFDAESKLVICNERYASIYGLPSELTKPGAAHASIVPGLVEDLAELGNGGLVEGVEHLRPVERHVGDRSLFFVENVFAG